MVEMVPLKLQQSGSFVKRECSRLGCSSRSHWRSLYHGSRSSWCSGRILGPHLSSQGLTCVALRFETLTREISALNYLQPRQPISRARQRSGRWIRWSSRACSPRHRWTSRHRQGSFHDGTAYPPWRLFTIELCFISGLCGGDPSSCPWSRILLHGL